MKVVSLTMQQMYGKIVWINENVIKHHIQMDITMVGFEAKFQGWFISGLFLTT